MRGRRVLQLSQRRRLSSLSLPLPRRAPFAARSLRITSHLQARRLTDHLRNAVRFQLPRASLITVTVPGFLPQQSKLFQSQLPTTTPSPAETPPTWRHCLSKSAPHPATKPARRSRIPRTIHCALLPATAVTASKTLSQVAGPDHTPSWSRTSALPAPPACTAPRRSAGGSTALRRRRRCRETEEADPGLLFVGTSASVWPFLHR